MARTRPLSPHLQVYRPQMTSVMSILHRAAGVVLTTGTLIMAAWLLSLALGKEAYDDVVMVIGHPLGQFVLFGYSVALIYHALNGVRHLGWDLGFGLTIPQVYKNGQIVLFLTVVLTMGLWSAVWM